MVTIEAQVKAAFMQMYFTNGNYLKKMHNNLIEQIKSYEDIIVDREGKKKVTIKNKTYYLPELPKQFTDTTKVNVFVEGLKRSKFFIS